MYLSYLFKLRPNQQQISVMESWLNMLRAHYNWCLADRISTYYQRFTYGEYCDIRTKAVVYPIACCIVKNGATGAPWKKSGKRRKAGAIQSAELPDLKKARPWYSQIESQVLQGNLTRLDTAYKNFFEGRGRFPKFKNRSNFRSFEYKPGRVQLDRNKIYLPKIGWMKFYNSRSIPDGFEARSVTVRKKADGWYISVRIEDKSVPEFPVMGRSSVKTAIGLDLGLTKLVHCSDGSQINNPRFATNQKTRKLMKIRQRRLSRKKKGGKNRIKAALRIGKLHKKISDRRESYQWKVANKIIKKADCIVAEDLNIKGMIARCKPKKEEETGRFLENGQSRKKGLNRAISDAAWGNLINKIEYAAVKSGKVFLKVNPQNTSLTCSECGKVDRNSRDREKFICTNCGHIDHADLQAARSVKKRGIEEYGLKIKKRMRPRADVRRERSAPSKLRRDSPKAPAKIVQLTLWETPTSELTGDKRRYQCAVAEVVDTANFKTSSFNVEDKKVVSRSKQGNGKRIEPGNSAGQQLELFGDMLGNSVSS